MDVKSAYLQEKGFTRTIIARLWREEKNLKALLKLLVPAYGPTDLGQLWYLTSYEALARRFGFIQSQLDPLLYYIKQPSGALIIVLQVYDYVYAVALGLASQLKTYLKQKFRVGSFETKRFHAVGVLLALEESVTVTLSATEKLNPIEPIRLSDQTRREKDRIATAAGLSLYRSFI